VLLLTEKLIQLVPEDLSEEGGYHIKAMAFAGSNDVEEEAVVLRYLAERDSSAMSTYLRLMELDLIAKDWPKVKSMPRGR
jgi:hypothetical protein